MSKERNYIRRRRNDCCIILSDHSMNSKWVQTEISKALEREKEEKRRMLFPVKEDCSYVIGLTSLKKAALFG